LHYRCQCLLCKKKWKWNHDRDNDQWSSWGSLYCLCWFPNIQIRLDIHKHTQCHRTNVPVLFNIQWAVFLQYSRRETINLKVCIQPELLIYQTKMSDTGDCSQGSTHTELHSIWAYF
jgi:hypothetical protein